MTNDIEMKPIKTNTLDNDKEAIFGMYKSLCMTCKHFDSYNYSCAAFPNGIPDKYLSGDEKHLKVDDDQTGDFIYSPLT